MTVYAAYYTTSGSPLLRFQTTDPDPPDPPDPPPASEDYELRQALHNSLKKLDDFVTQWLGELIENIGGLL